MDEVSRKVQKVSTRTYCPPKERDDCVARDELGRQFNGAMDEVSRKVQNASTYSGLKMEQEWRKTKGGVTSAGRWNITGGCLRRRGTYGL